jgi:transcriptional regulator with XRE-family HTH domain
VPKIRGEGDTSAFRRRVGRHIAAARERAGLQGQELAEKVGVRPSTVTDWEKGRKAPSVENLVAVARATRESVSFLLSDALPARGSLETISRELIATIGGRRAEHLLGIPERRLHRSLDAVIGEYLSETKPAPQGRPAQRHNPTSR